MVLPPPKKTCRNLILSDLYPLILVWMQRLASDFLSNYIFLAVGRVGSSTDLIVQRVEFVFESDKRSHLMDLLHAQRANGVEGKVISILLDWFAWFQDFRGLADY